MKQDNREKLSQSAKILTELKQARGGKLLESHLKMGNDPHLAQMFLNQYRENAADTTIPKKYRELITMAIGMATGTKTTTEVHARLAYENGASVDEITEVIRMIFFTCGVTKLLPIMEMDLLDPVALSTDGEQ